VRQPVGSGDGVPRWILWRGVISWRRNAVEVSKTFLADILWKRLEDKGHVLSRRYKPAATLWSLEHDVAFFLDHDVSEPLSYRQ